MKSVDHENNRVLIVDDQHEIHDDFKEMLRPSFEQPSTEDLAAAFMREEEEAWLPELELLHANNGRKHTKSFGRERNRTAPSPSPTSTSGCLRASMVSKRSAG